MFGPQGFNLNSAAPPFTGGLTGVPALFGLSSAPGLSSLLSGTQGLTSMMPGMSGIGSTFSPGTEASSLLQNPMGFQDTSTSMMQDYSNLVNFASQYRAAADAQLAALICAALKNAGQNGGGLDGGGANDGGGGGGNALDGGGADNAVNDGGNAVPNVNGGTLSPHGGWNGTQGPVQDLVKTLGPGFSVTSAKRDRKNTLSGGVSDHWSGNKNAYANDIGWGSSTPTAASDAAASKLVQSLGGPADWGKNGGVFNKTINGIRYQIIYRSNVGGNHFNHIHFGAKRV